MMGSLVALCGDSASLHYPETMGLAEENLKAQTWLKAFTTGNEAREFLASDHRVDEVWVVSSEDVAPINLAATLKADRPDRVVLLLAFQETGSLKSRLSAAGIDGALSLPAFVSRYENRKRRGAAPTANFVYNEPKKYDHLHQPAYPTSAHLATHVPSQGFAVTQKDVICAQSTPVASPAKEFQSQLTGHTRPDMLTKHKASTATKVSQAHAAFLMPVVSGSGGAGKSTVAVLAALISQRLGYDTLLLDFDLQFGDMAHLLGVATPSRIDEVIASPARLSQLRSGAGRPTLLGAPQHLEDAETLMHEMGEFFDLIANQFKVIICNTGAAWAEQHAVLLERSSKALFLIDQRPSSIRSTQHALDLCARCSIATGPFVFAINRCAKNAQFTSIDASCALGGAHVFELKDGGRDVEELVGAGLPWELLDMKNDLCGSLETLLLDLLPQGGLRASGVSEQERAGGGLRFLKSKASRRQRRGAACL